MDLLSDRAILHEALSRVLMDRWSCRQFLPEPVHENVIDRLLWLAQRTPSWSNTQPWQVIVTEGAGTDRLRKELLAHVQGGGVPKPDIDFPIGYSGEYRDRRRECGMQLHASLGISSGDVEQTTRQFLRNFEFFDAPHVAIITTESDLGVYGAVDCGLYINTFLLAAHTLGLAAAPQAVLASYSPFLHEYFELPANRQVLVGISFGYADMDDPVNTFRTERERPELVTTWQHD